MRLELGQIHAQARMTLAQRGEPLRQQRARRGRERGEPDPAHELLRGRDERGVCAFQRREHVVGVREQQPLGAGVPGAVLHAGLEPLVAVALLGIGASAVGFFAWRSRSLASFRVAQRSCAS